MFYTFISLATSLLATSTLDANKLGIAKLDADSVVDSILNTVYFFGGAAAVVAIIVGGFWYTTANGDASQVKKGKDAILYACIGLVIILMAFTITGFVSGRFA